MDDVDLNLLVALTPCCPRQRDRHGPTPLPKPLRDQPHAGTAARRDGRPATDARQGGMVPTPRAAKLRDRVHALALDARDVLGPQSRRLDVAALERDFTIRAGKGFIDLLAASLVAAVAEAAPGFAFASCPSSSRPPSR